MKDKIYELRNINKSTAELLLNETLFHNANGYIGIRSNFEEGYGDGITDIRGSYINGFYDFIDMPQAEKLYGLTEEKQIMLNVADTQSIRLFLGDEEFNMWKGRIHESRRTLNMTEGFSERYVHWESPGGKEVEICIRRIASFTRPSLFLIEYNIKAINFSGAISFVSSHRGDVKNFSDPNDPRVAAETKEHLKVVQVEVEGNVSFITAETSKSKLQICTAVDHALADKTANIKTIIEKNCAVSTINTEIAQSESLILYKYSIFSDSIRHGDCTEWARKEIAAVINESPKSLFHKQREYLNSFWDNALLEIEGDDELQQAVQFNLYQLVQSAGKDGHGSIAAKGLSGEGYEGHYFWDTEMYVEPFFTLANPAIAQSLISHRFNTLEEARKNAAILGHKNGVLFPWRTIMGKECSGFFPAGTAQYHINGDIAWSVVFYYLATGDLSFIAEKGAELVFECARLWIDMGNYYEGQFRINDVTGPDEYTCIVNNNYYTNICAKRNLEWAVKFYELLKINGKLEKLAERLKLTDDEIQGFSEAAQKMYLPYDEKTGINPQDDSFLSKKHLCLSEIPKNKSPMLLHYHPLYLYRHQICKQADTVLAHVVFNDVSKQTMINSLLYYEDITTHDSSLSTCIFSIASSRLGFHQEAYRYFGNSARMDLANTAGNTKDGLHIANMGGTYMAIIFGFAGLAIKESALHLSPHLPEHWKTCRFRLSYKGSLIEITIGTVTIHLVILSGNSVPVNVYGKMYELKDSLELAPEDFIMQIQKFKAVIFDLDGVLISTDHYHYLAWSSIAQELGIHFDENSNNALRGVSRMESLEIILKSGNLTLEEKEKTALAEKKNNIYRSYLQTMDPSSVDIGVRSILKHLKSMGIKIAVGSSSKNARFILEKTGLAPFFDTVVDGTDITKSKPDPEVFLKAAAALGVTPADSLVVEDAAAGIEAAYSGGFQSAAIGDAYNSPLATIKLKTLAGLFYFD
jgi:alpha,alpha-trehalose phosphorylase